MKDITGLKFGRWTALEIDPNRKGYMKCVCDCGTERSVDKYSLTRKNGGTKSCGCLSIDRTKEVNTTHGYKGSPTYSTWRSMIYRCTNPNHEKYGFYKGMLCNEWRDFSVFLKDMGERPNTKYSIDRIDNSKGYYKENCRWATQRQQLLNQDVVPHSTEYKIFVRLNTIRSE